jgi:hypothetical protein
MPAVEAGAVAAVVDDGEDDEVNREDEDGMDAGEDQ